MSKKTLFLASIALACTFFINSCRKNDVTLPFVGPSGSTARVITNVAGRVVDEDGAPVNGAIVTAGGTTTTTDINGQFLVKGAGLSTDAGVIKVSKTGFFNGFRTIQVSASAVNYAVIQLIPRKASGDFTAAAGGKINANNGGTLTFSSNSIINEASGASYAGIVKVAAFFLDPSDAAFADYSPGALRGINSNNNEMGLRSFGMMLVELEGTAGEKLQIAPGKTATINFPITPALQADAPSTIPLWHFDEVLGLWKEEGSATRQGNSYIGNVSHFSCWNCDLPFLTIHYDAGFKYHNGDPMPFTKISFTRPNGETRAGYTDAAGHLSAVLPAGETLVMKVMNDCGTVLLSQTAGQYNSDVNAGDIRMLTDAIKVNISGMAINCKGSPVINGVLDLVLDGKLTRTPISNGHFSLHVSRCDNNKTTAQLKIFDCTSGMQSDVANLDLTEGNIDAGSISTCSNTATEYMSLTVNGRQYTWLLPDEMNSTMSQSAQGSTFIESEKSNEEQSLHFAFPGGTTPGTYNASKFEFFPTMAGEPNSYALSPSGLTITITGYGSVSQYVTGSFSGNVYAVGGDTRKLFPVQGTFRVKRYS